MGNFFVINNVFGHLKTFKKLLNEWNPNEETLIIAGNLLNYGNNSYLVIKTLLLIKERYPDKIIFLKGKQEIMFDKFRKNPSLHIDEFLSNGGRGTLISFSEVPLSYLNLMDSNFLSQELLNSIDFTVFDIYDQMSLSFFETENLIFFSAEVDSLDQKLKEQYSNSTDKQIVILSQDDELFKLDYLKKYSYEINEKRNENDIFFPIIISLLSNNNESSKQTIGYRFEQYFFKEKISYVAEE